MRDVCQTCEKAGCREESLKLGPSQRVGNFGYSGDIAGLFFERESKRPQDDILYIYFNQVLFLVDFGDDIRCKRRADSMLFLFLRFAYFFK